MVQKKIRRFSESAVLGLRDRLVELWCSVTPCDNQLPAFTHEGPQVFQNAIILSLATTVALEIQSSISPYNQRCGSGFFPRISLNVS